MPEPLLQQQTIKYSSYVKETLVYALRSVFASHPDAILRSTSVDVDFPLTRNDYPAIVVRFYERGLTNAGVAHIEHIEDANATGRYVKYKHYLYQGDIEFAIYGLSSVDRDLVGDALVQILTMGETEPYSNLLLDRVYDPPSIPAENEGGAYDPSMDHMMNLNTDKLSGFGETQAIAPWMPEDVLVYQKSYRVEIHGEFYSRTPVATNYGLVTAVQSYPYNPDDGEPVPNPNPADPAPWEPGLP